MIDRGPLVIAVIVLLLAWAATLVLMIDGAKALQATAPQSLHSMA